MGFTIIILLLNNRDSGICSAGFISFILRDRPIHEEVTSVPLGILLVNPLREIGRMMPQADSLYIEPAMSLSIELPAVFIENKRFKLIFSE